MQILVVVANVQTKSLKIVVEKGFAQTVIVRKLVDPKKDGNTISICGELDEFCCYYYIVIANFFFTFPLRKGIRVLFLNHRSCCLILILMR